MIDLYESEPSADYPLGGSLEPYDIEREKEMLNEHKEESTRIALHNAKRAGLQTAQTFVLKTGGKFPSVTLNGYKLNPIPLKNHNPESYIGTDAEPIIEDGEIVKVKFTDRQGRKQVVDIKPWQKTYDLTMEENQRPLA